MTTYLKAPNDVHDVIAKVMQSRHAELVEFEVSVDCLMAVAELDDDGEPKGHPVKAHGYPAAAVVSIHSLKNRAQGLADALIVIDSHQWGDLSAEQRAALIDHELTHLELSRDNDGDVKYDDLNRPKLKMREHDWQVGGFDEVVTAHGANAVEIMSVSNVMNDARPVRQLMMNWG